MKDKNTRIIFFFIFALSGFSGLIYESIWTHYLKLFLGHAAYAQTLVLAIFMGGLAVGAWACSRYSENWKNLLLYYALAEGIIGLSAILFHTAFTQFIDFSYLLVIPLLDNVLLVNLYKWGMASVLILPQSILLGMTFPLMSSGIIRNFPKAPGNTISILYFTNSLGGAIGVLTSGFLLIKWIGLPGTIIFAGIINITLAITVWSLVSKQPAVPIAVNEELNANSTTTNKQFYTTLLIISLVTGVASFIYEISWIRMLSLVLGSSTHAFELMLSAFIFGLALGGFWIRKRIELINKPIRFLAWVQVAMGCLALSTLLVYGNSFNAMQWLVNTLEKTDMGYTLFNLSSHGIALAIMLPTTILAGMTLPLLTFSLIKTGHGEKSIGAVYGANTVGAIIGILIAVHIGMPLLGLKGLIVLGAAIDIAAGVALLWWLGGYSTIKLPTIATTIGIVSIISTVLFVNLDAHNMASGVYRNLGFLDKTKNDILDHKDGKTASVDLTGKHDGAVSIRTNGKTDAVINMDPNGYYFPDEATMTLAAAIPLLMKPDAKNVANIGLGSGLTTHTALQVKSVLQVDTVEIEQAIVDVAKGFRPRNELAYSDPRSQIHIEDAKTFFSSRNKKYDIIISEPSNPWVSGVSGLFSTEFYTLIKRHLTKEGLFVQWVQLYEFDIKLLASVLKTLSENFEQYDVYAPQHGDLLIIAKANGEIPTLNDRLLNSNNLAPGLNKIAINHLQDIMLRKIGNKDFLTPLLNDYVIDINSDYYPVLDQNAARARFLGKSSGELLSITLEPLPALELLGIYKPNWQTTTVTATRHFDLSEIAYGATVIRDQLIGNRAIFSANRKLQGYINEANNLKNLFLNCTASDGDKVLVLVSAALKLVPYLRPNELQAIWSTLESGSCMSTWSKNELLWFDFVKSMSNRDATKISNLANKLLTDSRELMTPLKKYLVAASIISNIALNDKLAAKQMWLQYRDDFFKPGEMGLLFRLLALHSQG